MTTEALRTRPDLADDDLVVLLDDAGRAVGTAPRATVHGPATPLHRAFSCYLFGPDGRLLLTRRAPTKIAFPDVWTNSVCGHPRPGEPDVDAVRRRAAHELGLDVRDLVLALPDFRYRATSRGIVENEICPVYLGRTDGRPAGRPEEVAEHRWAHWQAFLADLEAGAAYSPWSVLQAAQLEASGIVTGYLRRGRSAATT